MADLTLYGLKGINVNPTSSFLHVRIEDVDCSSVTNFPTPPIDGQFIIAAGLTGHDGWNTLDDNGGTDTNDDYINKDIALLDMVRGPALAMVWLSQFRTDQDALGSARVPVVRGPLRFKTKLFNLVHGESISTVYAPGTQLTVALALTAVSGTTRRLVLDNAANVGVSASAWVVGYVTRVINSSGVAGTGEIEVQLYEFPRLVTEAKD